MYVSVWICIPVLQASKEASRGSWSPLSCIYISVSWHGCWELNLGSLQEQALLATETNFHSQKWILSPVCGWVFSHPHKRVSSDRVKNHSGKKVRRKEVSWKLLCIHTKSTNSEYISNKSNIYTISQRDSQDLDSSFLFLGTRAVTRKIKTHHIASMKFSNEGKQRNSDIEKNGLLMCTFTIQE